MRALDYLENTGRCRKAVKKVLEYLRMPVGGTRVEWSRVATQTFKRRLLMAPVQML